MKYRYVMLSNDLHDIVNDVIAPNIINCLFERLVIDSRNKSGHVQ